MAPNSSHHHSERLSGPLISPETLAGWVDDPDLRIVDVRWYLGERGRGRQAYDAGHLPGALFLDVDSDLVAESGPGRHPLPSPADFARRLGGVGIGPKSSVVAYDDCGSWVAARLWWMLDDLGQRSVAVLDGGIDAWRAIGLPLSTDLPHFSPQSVELADHWTKVVDRETLRGQLGSVVLLDARSEQRYRGETEPIDAYPGHIPTARHAPTIDVLGSDGRFLPPAALVERFSRLGCMSDSETRVVTSCGSGVSACINALAMRIAGLPDPVLYPGSYSDWTQAGYPVARRGRTWRTKPGVSNDAITGGRPATSPTDSARSQSVERFVEVPGGRLFVADDGAGPPIVLLHARVVDQRAWDPVVPGLVAAGYRAVRFDARGFGRTETADVEFSNRADVMAVLDALGINRAALVGNSGGGQVAFDTAIEFPDRVVAVVGVGAGIGGFEGEPTDQELALFKEEERLQDVAPRDVDAIVDLDVRLWLDGPGQPPGRVDTSIRDFFRSMDEAIYVPGRRHAQPIVLQPPANDRLSELRCPVLAVAGALDVSDVAQTAHHLEADAPNARAMILDDVAHMIGLEMPARLVELIIEFLGPLRSWK